MEIFWIYYALISNGEGEHIFARRPLTFIVEYSAQPLALYHFIIIIIVVVVVIIIDSQGSQDSSRFSIGLSNLLARSDETGAGSLTRISLSWHNDSPSCCKVPYLSFNSFLTLLFSLFFFFFFFSFFFSFFILLLLPQYAYCQRYGHHRLSF